MTPSRVHRCADRTDRLNHGHGDVGDDINGRESRYVSSLVDAYIKHKPHVLVDFGIEGRAEKFVACMKRLGVGAPSAERDERQLLWSDDLRQPCKLGVELHKVIKCATSVADLGHVEARYSHRTIYYVNQQKDLRAVYIRVDVRLSLPHWALRLPGGLCLSLAGSPGTRDRLRLGRQRPKRPGLVPLGATWGL